MALRHTAAKRNILDKCRDVVTWTSFGLEENDKEE